MSTLLFFPCLSAANIRNGNVVTQTQSTSKRRVSGIYLNLDPFVIEVKELGRVSGIVVVKMNSVPRLAELRVGRWPGRSRLQVSLRTLLTVLVCQVEVDHNMVRGNLRVMFLRRIQILE